jgi:formamidopyrimidine-DNA glycosylase
VPELPEVELAAEQLRAWLGRIDAVDVRDARALRGQTVAELVGALEGRRVTEVERVGKHLVVHAGRSEWWIHLGMSGWLARRDSAEALPKATRWAVRSGDHWVGLVDPRIFGRTAAGEPAWVRETAKLGSVGPDARSVDRATLAERLAGTRRAIKVALMDQSLVAGLGNIQVAEALFRARIHPKRSAQSLDEGEVTALWEGMRGTLEDTLGDLRAQAADDGEVTYMSDGGDNPFSVYGREGEPCVRCGAPIARIVQGGRSTFFCPSCQPETP